MPRKNTIKFVRGTAAEIAAAELAQGEPAISTDTDVVYVGTADSKVALAKSTDLHTRGHSISSTSDHTDWPSGLTATELGYVDGVTSAIQTQINALKTIAILFVIDGGGSVITTGSKGWIEIPFACTVTGWTIVGNPSGSIVVDVKRATYANFPTTSSIASTEKPTLSSATKNQDLDLTAWTTSISAGDILEFVVDSASTVKKVAIVIRATRP